MVRRLPRFSLRLLAPAALALALAFALTGLAGGTALAASTPLARSVPQMPAGTIIYWTNCGSGTCYGGVDNTYDFTAHWNSGPCCALGIYAYWGDGGSDSYICWVNCGSGYAFFNHFWNSQGWYWTYACSGNSGGNTCSNGVWMDIYYG